MIKNINLGQFWNVRHDAVQTAAQAGQYATLSHSNGYHSQIAVKYNFLQMWNV